MEIRKRISQGMLIGGAAATALSLTAFAAAHVVPEPGTVEAGKSTTIAFRVGHGCEESPTTSLQMQIPDGVVGITVKALPGWEIETVEGPITPYESHGTTISEGVKEITWTGGPLADGLFELFTIRATIPDTPGETLYFPVIQRCEVGETAWIEIPEAGQDGDDLESPAPAVKVVASSGDGDGHGSSGDTQASTDANGGTTPEAQAAVGTDSSDDDGGNGIAWVALGVGVLGLVAGAGGLAAGLRKR